MGQISRVGVVGLGTMGAGVVEVLARAGVDVIGVEVSDAALARGRASVEKSTARAVERGKLTEEERAALLGRIRFTTDISELADRELAIEAVTEDLEIKGPVVADARQDPRAEAIIATNTSSLSVTQISVVTGPPRPRASGMHFFNPAPVLSFMEIVRTVVTAPDVVDQAVAFAESLGKEPVVVGDRAGFIANALLFGYLNHAATMYEAPVRLARGHRRRDAPGLRLPDGPAGPAGPDRPGHRVQDPGHDVQGEPRPAARAGADHQADGHRRDEGPQVRPGLLHLRGARLVDGGRRCADPGRGRCVRRRAHRSRRWASSAPARWPRGSSRSSSSPGTRPSTWRARPRRSPPCAPPSSAP